MTIKQWWLLLLCCFAFSSILIGQQWEGIPSEPGKCYAKCIMPSRTIDKVEYYLLPDSSGTAQEYFRIELFPISDPEERWVKVKADKNCESPDPEDCFVWCLVQDEPEVEERQVYNESDAMNAAYIASPMAFTYGQSSYIKSFNLNKSEEWCEVVCENDSMYGNIVASVQSELSSRGYYEGNLNESLVPEIKSALIEFQKDNALPIGNLDIMTLRALGIEGYENGSSIEIEEQWKACVFKLYTEPAKALFPFTINREVYNGKNRDKLIYYHYMTGEDVSTDNYDVTNPYHAIEINRKLQKLRKREPSSFTISQGIIERNKKIRKGGYESFDCVCLDDPNYPFYQIAVEKALSNQGYEVDNTFGETTKRSLAKYQIANHRPIGFLDYGTLDLLKINY